MTGTWCWWMFVNEHERNLFWSNISTNNHHLQISHPYHKMNHPTVEVLIEHLKKSFIWKHGSADPSVEIGPYKWLFQVYFWVCDMWEFNFKDEHPELGSFRMWNSKEWNYSNVLFESLVLNFNPLPQDVFIRNESEFMPCRKKAPRGVKMKTTHHRVKSNTINYAW